MSFGFGDYEYGLLSLRWRVAGRDSVGETNVLVRVVTPHTFRNLDLVGFERGFATTPEIDSRRACSEHSIYYYNLEEHAKNSLPRGVEPRAVPHSLIDRGRCYRYTKEDHHPTILAR